MTRAWRQTLEELQTLRKVDTVRIDTHLEEMAVLNDEYNQLSEQMMTLKARLYALSLDKVSSS